MGQDNAPINQLKSGSTYEASVVESPGGEVEDTIGSVNNVVVFIRSRGLDLRDANTVQVKVTNIEASYADAYATEVVN